MITTMDVEDIPYVIEIENASFSDPWSEDCFYMDLLGELAHNVVYFKDDKLVGYACAWLMPDEFHITNIAVDSNYRNQGIGKELMMYFISFAKGKSYDRMLLEVRVSNESAIKLYESVGFEIIHKMKRYYADNDEDGYLMLKRIN